MFTDLTDEMSSLDLEDEDSPLVREFNRDFGLDDELVPFIGRRQDREDIKRQLKEKSNIVCICGPPLVGKSRLAKQVFGELLRESLDFNTPLKLLNVDCENCLHGAGDEANICHQILQSISMLVEHGGAQSDSQVGVDDVIAQLKLTCEDKIYCLLLIDNCDRYLEFGGTRMGIFLRTCAAIVSQCKRIKIVTTCQWNISSLSRFFGKKHYAKRIKSLKTNDSIDLLRKVASTVDFGEYAEELVRHCCGLPGVLFLVGDMLEQRQGLLTPKEACELLRTESLLKWFDNHMLTDDLGIRQKMFATFQSISESLQRYCGALSFVSGSFSADAARAILKSDTVSQAKQRALIPLVDRGLLEYSEATNTFCMSTH